MKENIEKELFVHFEYIKLRFENKLLKDETKSLIFRCIISLINKMKKH